MSLVFRALGRMWIPLVLVGVVAVSATAVQRMHGIFGSNGASDRAASGVDRIVSFNPKRVLYEVEGPPGTVGSLSYLDENAVPHRAEFTTLPWSFLVSTTLPSMFANVVAQGDSDVLGCRITVNDVVRDDQKSSGHAAQAFCLVKAA